MLRALTPLTLHNEATPELNVISHTALQRLTARGILSQAAKLCLLCTLPYWFLYSALSSAAGTPTIAGNKLIGTKHPFVIFVANKPALQKLAEATLGEQRATNSKYQHASTLRTASKYDHELLYTFLRSQGYYAAKIESKNARGQVAHQIYPGPQFTLATIDFNWPSNVSLPPQKVIGIKEGDPVIAQTVLDSLANIKKWVLDEHCLREVNVSYKATVNHIHKNAHITFTLKPSQQVVFGKTRYLGHTSIQESYLDLFLGFEEGECFKSRLLDSTRLQLIQTNLLANAEPLTKPIEDGKVAIDFRLTERNQRSINAALGYDADIKTKVSTGWEHRNLMGRGEQLTADLILSKISQSIETELIFPHFKRKKQRLTLTAVIAKETPDAYDVFKGEVGANIKRELTHGLSANIGANITFSRVTEFDNPEDFALLSTPISLDYSARNNPLDPKHGWAAGVQVEPFIDLYRTGRKFTRHTLAGSVYHTAKQWALKPTFAMRMAAGVIDGSTLLDVPADQRFYVGGGGSVRGYRYQSISETSVSAVDPTIDATTDPIGPELIDPGTQDIKPLGGLSFSEVSFEVRSRISQSLGITVFVDGGYAYSDKAPKVGNDYLWSAGLGLRYHTSFAPFRIDIATPLDKREGDDSIQLYIAIGQAF